MGTHKQVRAEEWKAQPWDLTRDGTLRQNSRPNARQALDFLGFEAERRGANMVYIRLREKLPSDDRERLHFEAVKWAAGGWSHLSQNDYDRIRKLINFNHAPNYHPTNSALHEALVMMADGLPF